jgi:protein-tyrosine-phosphatase
MNMRFARIVSLPLILLAAGCSEEVRAGRDQTMIDDYIAARRTEFDRIEADRRAALDALAAKIGPQLAAVDELPMTFICTHNSRRSHLGQVWAGVAARHFGIAKVSTWSGGTEATACNPRTVAALQRAGFSVEVGTEGDNPVYRVRARADDEPMLCWSKKFDDYANPQAGFVAVMTCSSADEACPSVRGAWLRAAITYEDPKAFDGTERETEAYDERCAQIAREMLYLFERVARPV